MKFTIDSPPFAGEVFDLQDQGALTWVEAAQVEKQTGITITELDEADTGPRLRGRSDVVAAFLFVSVKRQRPTTTYAEFAATPMSAVQFLDTENEPDPTGDAEASQN